MRWWLAAVFVAIATLTAALIAAVSSRQADRELRANAENIALGAGISARSAVEQALIDGNLDEQLPSIGTRHNVALFVFSPKRRLIAQSRYRNVRWEDVPEPEGGAAVLTALGDRRYVAAFHGGRSTLVALPLDRRNDATVLVAYAPRPPYAPSLAIFRHDVVQASIWAVAIAALTGLVAATLIARRLRRISSAAAAIEQGDFARELEPGLHDEIGELALTIDRMRSRLGAAFEQLSTERDRLERLFEQLHEGVLAVDAELTVQFANTNAKDLLRDVSLEKGARLPDTYGGLPLRRVAEGLFVPGAPVAEARSRREDGATISLVGLPASSSDLVVLVFADITEQERRRQAEREFVTNASHELRTPVTAIASAVDALQSGAQDVPESRERFIDLIGRQANRLTRLSSSLLILARAQTRQENVQLEPVELRGLLEEIAAASDPAEGVSVRVDCPQRVVAVGQRDIVEQVVSNLVGNALKHTASGEVVLRAGQDGANATIEVADTGPGISPAVQSRVFDRFYSLEVNGRDGFGLGLAIARESAEAIGGSLTIDSERGRGTTAKVTLPAARRG
jgi:signal transduction histidine kinase/HAMP domain-containing protein